MHAKGEPAHKIDAYQQYHIAQIAKAGIALCMWKSTRNFIKWSHLN
jgi:hypothetical protein